MDPFSHAIVGGTAACASSGQPKNLKLAVVCGVVAGMLPDLDILIRQSGNPMLGLGFHRHFTHALLFVPFGAFLAALFVRIFFKSESFLRIYLFCMAGIATHGLLDSLTNYGTHLFWPLTDRRESWSVISIIDPVFTLTLLVLLVFSVWKKKRSIALVGVLFALSYWGFGYYQREKATDALMAQAAARGHIVTKHEVKPSIGNIFAWRGQYLDDGSVMHIDAYHVSPWRGAVIYEGGSLPVYRLERDVGPTQMRDYAYFDFFSDGWIAKSPRDQELLGDLRFSILPNGLEPIWGIKFQADQEKHVLFESDRTREKGDFSILWSMIKGDRLEDQD